MHNLVFIINMLNYALPRSVSDSELLTLNKAFLVDFQSMDIPNIFWDIQMLA